MSTTNKQKRIIISIIIMIALLLIIVAIINLIKSFSKDIDITNAIHGVIIEDNVELIYGKNKKVALSKGDNVYIIEDDILNQKYVVKYGDKVGSIDKTSTDYFRFDNKSKYALMSDVSQFNINTNFSSSGDFELFLLDNNINYVYIRLGGRGWGAKGNLYYDSNATTFIESCEYLGVPYGFYYLDEALNEEETVEEVNFVKSFLNENATSMNVLPLAIDLEYQEGKGRADKIWEERIPILTSLIDKFNKESIDCIVYANGNRVNEYLTDLDCNFWVARYPEDGVIPDSSYSTAVMYNRVKTIFNQLIDDEGKIKKDIDTTKVYKIDFNEKFLNKVIGWQFTENGASKDGIKESIDLSLVNNYFFRSYIENK